jgi:uncharacterized protein
MTSFRPDYGRGLVKTALLAATVAAAPALFPSSAPAASFDCQQQDLAADEKAICDDRVLNDADVKMVTTFDLLSGLLAMGARGSMQDAQIAWLTKRQTCGADVSCLRATYEERQKELTEIYDKMPRPF